MNAEQFFNTDISELFSVRTTRCLAAEDIYLLNDLRKFNLKSKSELDSLLTKIPNFGRKSLREFYETFKCYNVGIEYIFMCKEEKVQVSRDDLLTLHTESIRQIQIALNKINEIADQFKIAMEIQCKAHLTRINLTIEEWENKHK